MHTIVVVCAWQQAPSTEVIPIETRTKNSVVDVERELSLLARHHLSTSQRAPERVLDRSGYALLSRLEHGPMTLKQLAEAFHLDQSTVNRQIKALRRDVLVERIADPSGGVAQLLRPTRKGLRSLEHDRTISHEQIGHVLADWDAAKIEALAELLRSFNNSIEELEGQPWPRSD
ncbi:MAG TPA: MarR family transcriptional regulator [Marmoricola sp.]|nr:MarR family transcriptional regulator [Marmoricola sp.]